MAEQTLQQENQQINNNKRNEQQEVSTNKILNVGSPFLTQEKPTICNNQEIDENLNVNNLNSEERNKAMCVVKNPENRVVTTSDVMIQSPWVTVVVVFPEGPTKTIHIHGAVPDDFTVKDLIDKANSNPPENVGDAVHVRFPDSVASLSFSKSGEHSVVVEKRQPGQLLAQLDGGPAGTDGTAVEETVGQKRGALLDLRPRKRTRESQSSPVIYTIFIKCLDSGEKTILQVESSDTIAKVKDKIGNKLKCPPKKQILQLLDSGVLQDEKTVSDYYIRNNTDVALIVKTNTNMQILIRTLTGHTSYFMVNPTTTIAKLKLMYYNFVGIPCDQQRFVSSDGQQLEDGRNCSDYDITNGSVVYFNCNVRGC